MPGAQGYPVARIVVPYAIVGALWIAVSDGVLEHLAADPVAFAWWSVVKGLGFVAVTSTLLTLLLRAELDARDRAHHAIDQTATHLRQVLTEVESSQRRYRLLFEANPHPMWIYDIDTLAFLAVNDAAVAQYGYAHDEFLQMTLEDIRPPDDVAELHRNVASAVARETIQTSGPWRHRTRSGAIRVVDIASHGLEWNGRSARLVLAHDVTARELGRKALEASEARFRGAVDNSPVPIMLHVEDGTIVLASRSWYDITGYAPDQMPTIDAWTALAYGPRAPAVRALIARVYTIDGRLSEGEFPVRIRGGGTRIWDFHSASLGRLPDGRRLAVSMAMDVTDRRRAEDEARHVNATLERRVRERTTELEGTNRELEAFSYSVSHDLRAPLRAISGYARILGEDHGDHLGTDGRRVLDVIASEARRMTQLTSDLLEFSRTSRQPLHVAPTDMGALVREVEAEVVRGVAGRVIDVRISPLPHVAADRRLLRHVWVNLLDNAVKFTRHRTPARILVAGGLEGPEAVFSVRDNGVGFDMAHADRLFGVFQRLHPAEAFEGTGVGLALVQRIVHRHGGRVWVESEPERGTIVTFTLPAGAAPEGDPGTTDHPESQRSTP